jgi:hypothetical protein
VLIRDLNEFSDSKLRVGSGKSFHAFQQLFFSLLDIPENISLNLLIFGSVNLNDEENKAVFKSVSRIFFYIFLDRKSSDHILHSLLYVVSHVISDLTYIQHNNGLGL